MYVYSDFLLGWKFKALVIASEVLAWALLNSYV